jgi:hypothetical protein
MLMLRQEGANRCSVGETCHPRSHNVFPFTYEAGRAVARGLNAGQGPPQEDVAVVGFERAAPEGEQKLNVRWVVRGHAGLHQV